jgi:hypothetical protein
MSIFCDKMCNIFYMHWTKLVATDDGPLGLLHVWCIKTASDKSCWLHLLIDTRLHSMKDINTFK